MLEVVADAPGITHAGSGDDDLGGGVQVDGNRILFGFTDLQTGERQRVFLRATHGETGNDHIAAAVERFL